MPRKEREGRKRDFGCVHFGSLLDELTRRVRNMTNLVRPDAKDPNSALFSLITVFLGWD